MRLAGALFERIYWIICALVLVVVILRCALVPFAHDEVATFYFFIQSGKFLPFLSHVDAANHFLMSATSWVCFKLFGSSTLALRLPCILGFVLLCYAVHRINRQFYSVYPKILISSAFILSYNFISFYSLCRGYGISMSFLLMALFYFLKCINGFSSRHFFKFILFSQLALSANLTLINTLVLTTVLLMLLQVIRARFFKAGNLLLLLLHFSLIYFWVRYAFYLQANGALYYGGGWGYWQVTFKTLIETITFKSTAINIVILILFFGMMIFWCFRFYKERRTFVTHNRFAITYAVLCLLVLSFYVLKKFLNVNYPEDRTGLFFYLFFVLSLALMIEDLRPDTRPLFMFIPLFIAVHFVYAVNFKVHPWKIYETMPVEFYGILQAEQKKSATQVTIGGHRVREFFYGFMNYNSKEKLNHMTSPEALQMNCDYALAYKDDAPWYQAYYSELAAEPHWGFRLLKRKNVIERVLVYENGGPLKFEGDGEYYNAVEKRDTTFDSVNPLLAEFELSVQQAPVPLNAWLVLQIDGANSENTFIRVPLNLLKYDWNGTENFKTCLVSGNIPLKITRIVAYLWNIEKQPVKINLNHFRLYRLKGYGVTEISKAKI